MARHTLKLEEMGPWTGPTTRPIVRSITLAPETKIDRVHRSHEAAPAGWHGGYVTSPMSVAQLHAGEFTTVKVTRHGKQLTAVSVDVFLPSSAVRPMGS